MIAELCGCCTGLLWCRPGNVVNYLAVSESGYGVRRSNLQQLPGIIKMVCKILWAADQLSFPEANATAAAELFNYPSWWQQQPATGSRPVTAPADHFIHHPSIRGAISTHMSTLNRIISANYSLQTQPLLGGSNWHLSPDWFAYFVTQVVDTWAVFCPSDLHCPSSAIDYNDAD